MIFEIKHRYSAHVLFSLECGSLKLCLEAAVNARANLEGANLEGAYLEWANLRGAYLQGANGVNKHISTPLRILLDQPGKIRAYKLVTAEGASPINGTKLTYRLGETVEEANANTDEAYQCSAGISLATLDWCLREWCEGWRILVCEFEATDIAAIPTATDGKFRVRRCTVVGEKSLAELDWPPKLVEKPGEVEKAGTP